MLRIIIRLSLYLSTFAFPVQSTQRTLISLTLTLSGSHFRSESPRAHIADSTGIIGPPPRLASGGLHANVEKFYICRRRHTGESQTEGLRESSKWKD